MSEKRRNWRLTFALAAVLLAAIAVFSISVLSDIQGARLDLTEDKLFTMSPAAVNILEQLQVPVQVKLYITPEDRMPTEFRNLERDIAEQLRNYERVSGGQLQFSVHNPQDDEEMQQDLGQKGIQPFQVQSVDKDEIGVKLIWSALTIAYKDQPEEVVPRILPQTLANLESLVIGPVHRLTRDSDPLVAVYAPRRPVDPQMAAMYLQQGMQPPEPQEQFSMVSQLLQQEHYRVQVIDLTADSGIPADADVLVVLGPRELGPRQAWEINRALSNGMPVVMAVQSHDYSYQPTQRGGWTITANQAASGVEDLLAGLGLSVVTDHFMDRNSQMLELPREVNLGGLRMQVREPVDAPVQVRITQDQVNQDAAITNHIGQLLYLWGTPVQVDAAAVSAAGLRAETLISSSDRSWLADFGGGMLSQAQIDPDGNEMTGPYPLAVLLDGEFPDTFGGGEPPAWPDAAAADADVAGPTAPAAALSPAPSRLLVVGCAKMFDDMVLQGAQNALLLLNAVDYLAGSEDVLTIRSRQLTQRTIGDVPAGQKLLWQLLTWVTMPALFIVLGVVRAVRRSGAAARYRRDLRAAGEGRS
jgi:ABC-2 type transport system permease protein